jgi:hypothetical protein
METTICITFYLPVVVTNLLITIIQNSSIHWVACRGILLNSWGTCSWHDSYLWFIWTTQWNITYPRWPPAFLQIMHAGASWLVTCLLSLSRTLFQQGPQSCVSARRCVSPNISNFCWMESWRPHSFPKVITRWFYQASLAESSNRCHRQTTFTSSIVLNVCGENRILQSSGGCIEIGHDPRH